MKKIFNLRSVTLVEVMVAMVILATCVAGMYATFIAGRKAVTRSKRKLIAINYARQVAESLKSAVRQDTYDTGNLSCPGGLPGYPCDKTPNTVLSLPLPSGLFNPTANYHIENLPVGSTNMRKVTITVTWTEPNEAAGGL